MSILIIAEHDNSELKTATLNTVAAGQAIGGEIDILVAGADCDSVAESASQIPGVNKVLLANKESYKNSLAENLGNLVVELAEGYTHILAPATTSGKNFMPRVAAKLDVSQVSDISAVVSEDTFERPIYAGNCIATVQSTDSVKVVTVRITGFDACDATGGSATITSVDNDTNAGVSSFVKEEIAPDLYIAVGISGAIQHLAGMKDSKVIVAINKDEDAPIFQVADYGLVADLFEALPELESKL